MSLDISRVTPMLQVRNLDETIEFYTTTLDFELGERAGGWCHLEWGGAEVMFYEMDAPDNQPSMTGVLYFNPKDVKALWEHLKDRVTVEWGLQKMEYGMVEFAIRDCNSYILSFGQEADEVSI